MESHTRTQLLARYPAFAALEPASWQNILHNQKRIILHPGKVVFRNGEPCEYFLLLLEGAVRVQRTSSEGHEIALYHLKPGQICELATACLLTGQPYPVEAVAEIQSEILLLAKEQFHALLSTAVPFQREVFKAINEGLSSLVTLVEEIAFEPLDRRLAQKLLALAGDGQNVKATHYAIAAELGTAREVISRLLKTLERRQLVHCRRGQIELRDIDALKSLAQRSAV